MSEITDQCNKLVDTLEETGLVIESLPVKIEEIAKQAFELGYLAGSDGASAPSFQEWLKAKLSLDLEL